MGRLLLLLVYNHFNGSHRCIFLLIIISYASVSYIRRLALQHQILDHPTDHRLHLFRQLVIGGYKHGTISALYILLTFPAGLLTYESMHGDAVAPFLIFPGLPLIWILLLAHAARISRAQ